MNDNPESLVTTRRAVAAAGGEMEVLSKLTTPQLREEMARAIGRTAEHMLRLAMIVRLLEERGEDLSDLRVGMLDYLRKIAFGQLLPDAVVRFQGSPAILARVAALALPDQRRMADGEPLKLYVWQDGELTHRLVDPLRMTQEECTQAFARDHVRDEAEQVVWLRSRSVQRKPRSPVRLDADRGGIVVSGKGIFLSLAELKQHIATLDVTERVPAESELIPRELREIVEEEWKRYPRAGRRGWLPVEESLLGRASDRVVAEYLGRNTQAVVQKRKAKGIPAFNRRPAHLDREKADVG